jgi:ABC-2 type transport system permease protein
MNPHIALATAARVLKQLRHDPRTVVLLIAVPSLLLVLVRYVFDSAVAFSSFAPALLGVFPFTLMFLVTSITTLRERTGGTLERLMTTPMAKLDLLVGYALAFGLVALVQVVVAVLVSVACGLTLVGSYGWLLLVTAVDALLGVAIGLFASAFARTEFQALQFMPVIVFPQLLLCGLFQPRAQMATVLRWASNVMPISYAVEALKKVSTDPGVTGGYVRDVCVVAGCAILALILAAATLRRRTP